MQIIIDNLSELEQLADLIYRAKGARTDGKPPALAAPFDRIAYEHAVIDDMAEKGLINSVEATARHATLYAEQGAAIADAVGADPGVEVGATSHGRIPTESTGPSLPEVAALAPEVDSTGRPWDERIDSSNKALTDKGVWRARRNVPAELREQVLAEWEANQLQRDTDAVIAESEPADEDADEPVATETHALPKDEVPALAETAATGDLAGLLTSEVVTAAAQDASDSHADLIKACQGFISDHGHAAFNALKGAVAPLEGSPNGAALPMFTPGQRRLMQAAIANYALFV